MTFFSFISSLFWILGGYLVGLFTERFVIGTLTRLAEKTKWEGDNIILASLRRFPLVVFTLTGIYFALQSLWLEESTSEYVRKGFIVLLILAATTVFSRLAVGFLNHALQRFSGGVVPTTLFTTLAQVLVFTIGILTVLHTVGISITPILTALGVGGLAVALALQDTLSNLFAGLTILASRQIVPGHYVALDSGQEGTVTDITWRNTTLQTLQGNLVIIPNSKIASAIVTNFALPAPDLTVRADIAVSYDSDLAVVEATALEAARSLIADLPQAHKEFEPVVRFTGFGESSINVSVFVKVAHYSDQFLIRSELYRRLFNRFKSAGIEIPFPVRTVFLRGSSS